MSGETQITIVGNVTADPVVKSTPNGHDVASIRVAVTPRTWDSRQNDYVYGQPEFYNVSFWRNEAHNIAQSVHKGDRVIVSGNFKTRQYKDKNNIDRTALEIVRAELGVSLKFATAGVTRQRAQNFGNQQQGFNGQQQGSFGTQEEPPF